MGNLRKRVTKRWRTTIDAWKNDCHFSTKLACYRLLDELGGRIGLKKLSFWAHKKKDRWIINYLEIQLQPVIRKFQAVDYRGEYVDDAPIWVCWWTGEESAPLLVNRCIGSIRENAGSHDVILISEMNYRDYIEIPRAIVQMAERGTICIANFSDYLRVSLLEKYGGLWLDATIFLTSELEKWYFDYPFFTCKQSETECGYVSKMRWTSFCIGGFKHFSLFSFMRESFEKCWAEDKRSIDYLLIDYITDIGIRHLPCVAAEYEKLPNNNEHKDDLQKAFNDSIPGHLFNSIAKPINKLSWREHYSETTGDGQESVYSVFLKGSYQ